MPERTPEVTMTVSFEPGPDNVSATVTLDGLGLPYKATADAWRSHRDPEPNIEFALAVSRALSRLQHEIMESIHERIDRTTDDI